MLELYRAIEPYLAAIGLTALSGAVIFGALLGALRWFGERWVVSKFSERLEAFKHAQQREIEQLKFQISASMDRAVKLHQREFETVPEAWSTLVTAFNSIKGFTSRLQSYADLAYLTDQELTEFFEDSELTRAQKDDIRSSSDRNKSYQEAIFWHRLASAQNDFRMHNVFLIRNAIFMPTAMKAKFVSIGDLAWDALMEHKINREMGISKAGPKVEKFEKLGDSMLLELETEIQRRLWSDVSAP
jgi:hypothetical protein